MQAYLNNFEMTEDLVDNSAYSEKINMTNCSLNKEMLSENGHNDTSTRIFDRREDLAKPDANTSNDESAYFKFSNKGTSETDKQF